MHQFDHMAKVLAVGLTRREVLRQVGGGLAGALFASLGLRTARAAPSVNNCAGYCRSIGILPGNGNAYGKCVSNCSNCISAGGTACGADTCCTGGKPCTKVTAGRGTCGCGPYNPDPATEAAHQGACDANCVCVTTVEGQDECVQFSNGADYACVSDADCRESFMNPALVCVDKTTGGRACINLCGGAPS